MQRRHEAEYIYERGLKSYGRGGEGVINRVGAKASTMHYQKDILEHANTVATVFKNQNLQPLSSSSPPRFSLVDKFA